MINDSVLNSFNVDPKTPIYVYDDSGPVLKRPSSFTLEARKLRQQYEAKGGHCFLVKTCMGDYLPMSWERFCRLKETDVINGKNRVEIVDVYRNHHMPVGTVKAGVDNDQRNAIAFG